VDEIALAERVRAFNRFYTETIGALDDRHEGLPVSLAQSRMLRLIATTDAPQTTRLARSLKLDLPYASRVLGALEDNGLIRRRLSSADRRERVIELTAKGKRTLRTIEQRSNERVVALTADLDSIDIDELLHAMATIERLLTPPTNRPPTN
jgi:DNA-binding MarR family transcriptional regulator